MEMSEFTYEPVKVPKCPDCALSIYCAVEKHLDANPIVKMRTSVEIEAEQIMNSAEFAITNAELEQRHQDLRDRLAIKFAGDPEGLQRALDVLNQLRVDTLTSQLSNDIMHQEFLGSVENEETAHREKIEAVDAALDLREKVGCSGLREVKVGRFLSKKTVFVCGLRETPEFSKIRKLHDDDAVYIQKLRDEGRISNITEL